MSNNGNTIIYQASPQSIIKDLQDQDSTIRLTREDGGGIIIQQGQQIQLQNGQQLVVMDHDEKKMRRQIANSNERRRMQSINAGFQSLRQLLPHHEGEKLSKAAILQQTAEYIDRLEADKIRLVNQNSHLKRLVEGDTANNNNTTSAEYQQLLTTSPSTCSMVALKKRKLENTQTDSSDEGLGSMSPEPISQLLNSGKAQPINQCSGVVTAKDYLELQKQMEHERRLRIQTQEQVKQLENQCYTPLHYTPPGKYEDQDEDEDLLLDDDDMEDDDGQVSVHYVEHAQPEQHQQYIILSPRHLPAVPIMMDDDNSRTLSSDELNKDERSDRKSRVLEQVIKAEPKVEVERIQSPLNSPEAPNSPQLRQQMHSNRTYPNQPRSNLETIVEAIRHLEGDKAFDDVAQPSVRVQEVPLALTNKQKDLRGEITPFLKFHTSAPSSGANLPTIQITQKMPAQIQHQYRPNSVSVIVGKQS